MASSTPGNLRRRADLACELCRGTCVLCMTLQQVLFCGWHSCLLLLVVSCSAWPVLCNKVEWCAPQLPKKHLRNPLQPLSGPGEVLGDY